MKPSPQKRKQLSPQTRQKLAFTTGSHSVSGELCDTIDDLAKRVEALEAKPDATAKGVGQDLTELFRLVNCLREQFNASIAAPEKEPEQKRGPISGFEPGTEPAKKKSRGR